MSTDSSSGKGRDDPWAAKLRAQGALADSLWRGKGCVIDLPAALSLYLASLRGAAMCGDEFHEDMHQHVQRLAEEMEASDDPVVLKSVAKAFHYGQTTQWNNRWGLLKDVRRAMRSHIKAAEAGDVEAQIELGRQYEFGKEREATDGRLVDNADLLEAIRWYEAAITNPAVTEKQKELATNSIGYARMWLDDKHIAEAAAEWEVADRYRKGDGVAPDVAQEVAHLRAVIAICERRWYQAHRIEQKGAGHGQWAAVRLGFLFTLGDGVPQDDPPASE